MKQKICILQNGLARGGTDTFVVNLCRGLDKTLYDITVINPSNKSESLQQEKDVIEAGAQILHTSPFYLGLKSKIKHFWRLYKILKKGKFDVFQTNVDLFNGPQLFVAWIARVPVRCCHSHNTMQQKTIVQGMTFPIRVYQSLMKWMCWTFSNRRSGCSVAAMDFLFEGKPWRSEAYPTIVNNGIDIEKFRYPINISKKKKELGLKVKYNIATVGRIIPQKNPLFITETISQLFKIRDDVDFVWVGVGELEQQCKDILAKDGYLNRVHFLGSRTDVSEILPCCDLFYMPSVFEGLGIVIVEAQAAGLQCLVSDAIPSEANCGAVYYLSLADSKQCWAQVLSDMLDKKIDLHVNEETIKSFSINNMVQQMTKVFKA